MATVFGLANHEATRSEVNGWLKKEEDPDFLACSDATLEKFLNGLIIEKRGKKDGPEPEPAKKFTNNIVFVKLKIALNLKADEILKLMHKVDFIVSKHELSAFFRKPGHKNYRVCKDQYLRNFLNGLQLDYRGTHAANEENEASNEDSVWGKR